MIPPARSFRVRFAARIATLALLVFALALGGCMMNAGGGNPSDAPATDAAGKPLINVPTESTPLSNDTVAAPSAGAPGEVDFRCKTDADCVVKNVGNCCGYYPACVNIDSPTFPEQVMAECARTDTMAVCGFRDIAGCQCVEGRCSAIDAGAGPVR